MHAVSLLVSLACLEMAIAFAVQKSLWSTSGTECSVCSFVGADKHRMFSVAAQRTRSQLIRMDDAMGTDVWPMRDSRLAVQGKDVWVSDGNYHDVRLLPACREKRVCCNGVFIKEYKRALLQDNH